MNETITITGNVATMPEHKRSTAGVPITTFRVASEQRRYDRQTGAWADGETNWYTVSTYRGLADHAFQSLRKGDRVLLTGRLKVRTWENGERKGTSVEIDAEAIGHDLLWGISHFEKDAPRGATATRASAGDASDTTLADEWAAPGVDAADAESGGPEWPVVALPDEEGVAPAKQSADVAVPF